MTTSQSSVARQPVVRPGELARFVTDPAEQLVVARRHARVLVIVAAVGVLAAVGAVLLPRASVLLWVVVGLAVVAAAIYALLLVSARRAATLAGDDLIDLIVLPDGFVTQGGFPISWPEVKQVEAHRSTTRVEVKGSLAGRAGAAAGAALTAHEGADVAIRIHLHDAKAALARATTKSQRLAIVDGIGTREGYVQCALGLRPAGEIAPLLALLEQQSAARGVPFVLTTP